MKVFMFFINSIFWLWLLIVPTGLFSFLAFLLYEKNNNNFPYSVFLAITGVILGIILAEYVRKNYGLDNFFGRISASPDVKDRNILDDKTKTDEKSAN